MRPRWFLVFTLGFASAALGQDKPEAIVPFTLTWTEGKCVRCETASELGRIQVVGRSEAWAIGSVYGEQGTGDFIVVHTKDAGHTWRELPQTHQHAGDADGPPAFSFLDAKRGWIAWWNPSAEPKIIRTRDGGLHWQRVSPPKYSQQSLQKIVYFDENLAYGTEVRTFFKTNDGGHKWNETEIPDLRFIDKMLFPTPERGWIAGTDGKSFFVFRTTNGGRDWQESRTAPPKEPANVRDLFFLDQSRGWLITWHYNDDGTYLFFTADGGRTWLPESDQSFQGKGKWAGVVRFVSEKNGFVFMRDGAGSNLVYTTDGGAHWQGRPLPHDVYDCQIFEGDLLCSAGLSPSGFWLLTVHPK